MNPLDPRKKSAMEELITDLTGDVGALHNSVKRLQTQLPSLLSQVLTSTDRLAEQRVEKKFGEAAVLLNESLAKLPGAADLELKRASGAAIAGLASEVGKLAKQRSDIAAAAERNKAFYLAAAATAIGASLCIVLGFGAGLGWNKLEVSRIESNAQERVDQAERNVAWMQTDQGKAAKQLANLEVAEMLLECTGKNWRKQQSGKLGMGPEHCFGHRTPRPGNGNGWKIKE